MIDLHHYLQKYFYSYFYKCWNCLLLLSMTSLASSPSMADEQYRSGLNKVSVIELYTSEGCSSCPPADRWLSGLRQNDELFKSVIPLAFHVDYWNDLGWRDEFSDAAFSARQRRYHQLGHTQSVYTPGFVIDGQEWRGFFNRASRNAPPKPNERVGELILSVTAGTYAVTFKPVEIELTAAMEKVRANQVDHKFVVHLAYLGTDIRHQIKSGENAGKELKHDFVVLAMDQTILAPQAEALKGSLKRSDVRGATAVAAWVSRSDDPTPIQAVAGWL